LTAVYPEKINFSIRFMPGMNKAIGDFSASSYLIRYWQYHIHGQKEEFTNTQEFIGDWYAHMNPKTFAAEYPANGELSTKSNGTELLEDRHYGWVKENEIAATPTFFINGYKMPRSHRINDLMPMLPGLAALINEQKTRLRDNELAQKQEG
jgi:hypothetical protein